MVFIVVIEQIYTPQCQIDCINPNAQGVKPMAEHIVIHMLLEVEVSAETDTNK